MDTRYAEALMQSGLPGAAEAGVLWRQTAVSLQVLEDNLDTVDSRNRVRMAQAITTSTQALSELSISTSKMIAILASSPKAEAIGAMVAEIIKTVGAVAQMVHSLYSVYATGGRSGSDGVTRARRDDHIKTATRLTPEGLYAVYRDLVLIYGTKRQVMILDVAANPDGQAVKKTMGYQLRQVRNEDLSKYVFAGGPGLFLELIKDNIEDSYWTNVKNTIYQDSSLTGWTTESYQAPYVVVASIKYATIGAFTNFNDNTLITGGGNKRTVAVVPLKILDGQVQLPVGGTFTKRTVDGVVTLFEDVTDTISSIHNIGVPLAFSAAGSLMLGPVTGAAILMEGALALTQAASSAAMQIVINHMLSSWEADIPDGAVHAEMDDVGHIISFNGTLDKAGNADTYYTDKDDFTGWETVAPHQTALTPPVTIGKTLDDLYDQNPGLLSQAFNKATSIISFGNSADNVLLRGKVKAAHKTLRVADFPNTTGAYHWGESILLSEVVPEFDVLNFEYTTSGGAPVMTDYSAIAGTPDFIAYITIKGENFIIARYDVAGGAWVLNPTPTKAV
jgi:hypothetical protein